MTHESSRTDSTVQPCEHITVHTVDGKVHEFQSVKYRLEGGWLKLTVRVGPKLKATIFPSETVERVEVTQ